MLERSTIQDTEVEIVGPGIDGEPNSLEEPWVADKITVCPFLGNEESRLHLTGLRFIGHDGQGGSNQFASDGPTSSGKADGRARLFQKAKRFRDLAVEDGPRGSGVELGQKSEGRIPGLDFDEDLRSRFLAPVGIEESRATARKTSPSIWSRGGTNRSGAPTARPRDS